MRNNYMYDLRKMHKSVSVLQDILKLKKKIKIKLAIFREAGYRWYVRLDRRFKPAE